MKRIWCKTLGTKISKCNKEADTACVLRTLFVLLNVLTCIAIIANIVGHW